MVTWPEIDDFTQALDTMIQLRECVGYKNFPKDFKDLITRIADEGLEGEHGEQIIPKKFAVFVELFQGVINDVKIVKTEDASKIWFKWAKEHGYKNYQEFINARRDGDVDEELNWYPDLEVEE